jgi:iron(III) transport system substrate-binding protein
VSESAPIGKKPRWLIPLIVVLTVGGMLGGYAIREGVRSFVQKKDAGSIDRVVVYTSADDPVARDFVALAQHALQLDVQFVGDTEATKSTGIAQRLIDEAAAPKANIWWSNEELATARLVSAGVLEETELATFAARARVIAYSTTRVKEPPRTLRDVVNARFAGRIGMARPQFGTTRAQLAALVAVHGETATQKWLLALKAAQVRLYDGNSAVVRGIAQAEIDVGLTDTDDVWSAKREKWPVEMVFEVVDPPQRLPDAGTLGNGAIHEGLASMGPLRICNTAARVKGMTSTSEQIAANAVLDLLRSKTFEIAMAQSDSRTMPLDAELAQAFAQNAIPAPWVVDAKTLLQADERAQKLWERVMGR